MSESAKAKSTIKEMALFVVMLPALLVVPFIMFFVSLTMGILKLFGLVDRHRR
jgi:hypothetical protein